MIKEIQKEVELGDDGKVGRNILGKISQHPQV